MELDRLEVIIEAEAKKANAELDKMIGKLNQVSSALGKTTGFSFGTKGVASATTSMQRTLTSSKSLTSQLGRLAAGYYSVRKAVNFMNKSMEKSMDYVETVNLFQTSLKKIGMEAAQDLGMEWGSESANAFAKTFIDRAESFNDMLVDSLVLDPQLMKNYQAVFAQMTNSMNLVSDTSMNISETFTMLGNDIASLWNIDTDKAMKKLQSGLAGQIRPLRELGIDISKTSLEMYALNHGIEDSVEKMSQAAKVQLRYLAIMEQAEVAFGDMAKTIESPANQLRILSQQWTNLSRSIGNVFLPIVTNVLPYINGLVIALRNMTDALATAMGYEVPDYSDSNIYKDLTGDIGDMENVIEDTTDANERLKKSMMKWDELNILSEGKLLGNINLGSGYTELDEAINQKSLNYFEKFNEEMSKMSNRAKEIASEIQPKLQAFVDWLDKISPILEGIAAAFITYKVITWFGDLASALGKLNPTTGVIALAIGALVAIYEAVKKYNKHLMEEDLASRFGDITLSLEEIKKIADTLTASEYTANIDIFISESQKLDELEGNIAESIATIQKLDWKISIGMELTEGEITQYKQAIESFITNMDAYIEQQHYVTTLAIDAVIQDANFKTEMTELVDRYFDGSKGEMERLGKQLRSTMDGAIADGIIDAEEQKVINNLMKEIAIIQKRISDAEFVAKLQTIELDGDLDAESYKKLFSEIQEQITGYSKQAQGASEQLLTVINAQYVLDMENATTPAQEAEITRKYNADVKGIQNNLSDSKLEISELGLSFAYEKIYEKWQPEMDSMNEGTHGIISRNIQDAVDEGMLDVDPGIAMHRFWQNSLDEFNSAYKNSGMDSDTRKNLESFLKVLEPTEADDKKLAKWYAETGQIMPDTLSDRMTLRANLKMLADDIDGVYYVMGQQMADSPEILTMIANGKLTAQDLMDDGVIDGLKSRIPDLKLTGDGLVFDLDGAIKKAAKSSGENNMPSYAKTLLKGVTKTIDDDTSGTSSIDTWLGKISDKVRTFKLPTMEVNIGVNTSALEAFRKGTQAAGINVHGFATGGYPDTGQLFVAREAGPELVGSIGNRPAVANNDQIVQAVSQGVAMAVASVMGSSGGKAQVIENIVNLDGDTLYRAFNKAKQSNDMRFNPVMQGG